MKELVTEIAKALVDIPDEVTVREVQANRLRFWNCASRRRFGESDRQTGPDGAFDPDAAGRRGHEAEPAVYAGDSGVGPRQSRGRNWVAIGRLWRTRGNRGELIGEMDSSNPDARTKLKEVVLEVDGRRQVDAGGRDSGGTMGGRCSSSRASIRFPTPRCGQAPRCLVPERSGALPEEGEYSHADLIGCKLLADAEVSVGVVDGSGGVRRPAAVEGGSGGRP